jgi:hypothetical protein
LLPFRFVSKVLTLFVLFTFTTPIANNAKDHKLLSITTSILDGLLDANVNVVLLACNETEVERSIHCLLMRVPGVWVFMKTINNPVPNAPNTNIMWIEYQGHMIALMQDLKYALKTFRNNLFSGARLLVFGNFATFYQHICQIAFEEGLPLYHRDVKKLDRQDNNTATRLFSSGLVQYIVVHYPSYVGEIVFLFVFGELVDAYQNRHISHYKRIKMVLRA